MLLCLILLTAFCLRIVELSSNPAGFFRDEADKGYTSYSLFNTGKDQSGKILPFFVLSLKVTTSALYQYLDIPFIWIFGLNEFAVRLPACLTGTLSVLAAYLLARHWWGRKWALWAALFVCLSPWSLLLSRWANQSILLTFWIPIGIYFYIRDHHHFSYKNLILSAIFFLLALYTYAPARLVIPVIIVLLIVLRFLNTEHSQRILCLRWIGLFVILMAVGSIPMAQHIFFEPSQSTSRLSNITIFDGQPWYYALQEWCWNYLLHLSPNFLFASGDQNVRHNTAVFGQVHWFLLPLMVAGLIKTIIRRRYADQILLAWFLVFPIAAACTRESIPHALRSVFAVPVIQLLSVQGMMTFSQWFMIFHQRGLEKNVQILKRGWLAALLLLPTIHLYDLYFRYPIYSALDWEYGYKEAVNWWDDHKEQADQTLVSGIAEYPYIFFLFYQEYPPELWMNDKNIPNVTFVPTGQPISSYLPNRSQRSWLLVRPHELPNLMPTKTISAPNGDVVWKWVAWGPPIDSSGGNE